MAVGRLKPPKTQLARMANVNIFSLGLLKCDQESVAHLVVRLLGKHQPQVQSPVGTIRFRAIGLCIPCFLFFSPEKSYFMSIYRWKNTLARVLYEFSSIDVLYVHARLTRYQDSFIPTAKTLCRASETGQCEIQPRPRKSCKTSPISTPGH